MGFDCFCCKAYWDMGNAKKKKKKKEIEQHFFVVWNDP